jgi:uncharacterized protein
MPDDARGDRAGRLLALLALGASRRAAAVIAAVLALTAALGLYAATNLGVDTNPENLLAPDLPFQERMRRFEARFPVLTESLIVVIDAGSAAEARDAARLLAARLANAPHVRDVFALEADPFFERHALLYRTTEEVEEFADRMAELQPVIAALAREPDLSVLAHLIEEGLVRYIASGEAAEELPQVLEQFGSATVSVYDEHPLRLSWEEILLEGSAFDPTTRRTLVVDPVLRFDALLPAAEALAEIRRAAREADLVPERGVRVRITGYPALNHEEMLGLLYDVGISGVVAFGVVLILLFLALRSVPAVIASALTLLVGLVWTAAFAAAAVGALNLISLTFAVLFIGLGVDFAIHLMMHYLDERRGGCAHETALGRAVRDVGSALATCTVTTAVGFLAFVPTDYRGVAELGLVAGAGMFVIFGLTLTFLPALLASRALAVTKPPPAPARPPRWIAAGPPRRPRLGVGLALAGAAVALALAPSVRFDSNVVAMRNPATESVQAWDDLLEEGVGSPWYVDLVAQDLTEAEARAARVAQEPEVAETLTLADFVPEEQEIKRAILEDLAFLLDVPPAPPGSQEPLDAREQVEALRTLFEALGDETLARSASPLAAAARLLRERLATFLTRLEREPGPTPVLAELQDVLFADLPRQLARLRATLEPGEVTLEDLPLALVARMQAADGSTRVQVFPRDDLRDPQALAAFVDAVRRVDREATGLPVQIVEFGRATASSLREAMAIATLLIGLLILAVWRRPLDAALALLPLLLAALWTVGALALLDRPFNFANVIVLPLLLGIGVDSGVHLVARARRRALGASEALGDTATGRAVFYSALTTLLSFGSLAFSLHRGIASLGQLLALGMAFTLVANLMALPSFLALRGRAPNLPPPTSASASRTSTA